MTSAGADPPARADGPVQDLLGSTDLAGALESREFKQFLDHVPMAIAVARLGDAESIVYSNEEFARISGRAPATLKGQGWDCLTAESADGGSLCEAIPAGEDHIGVFLMRRGGDGAGTADSAEVDAWSNVIEDEAGRPVFRLVALAETAERRGSEREELERLVRAKDVLLRELQHRVKNNLQMITALIRLEARAVPDKLVTSSFDRLAGRVEALALLYRALSDEAGDQGPNAGIAAGIEAGVDLGTYLSEIASAVMHAHAPEGIRLDISVDTWPVSVNVALPTGLVVNELLTNALKHAFVGRDGGTVTLQSRVDEAGCRILVADDGIGLGTETWPQPGKMSAMMVQSLRQNAKAQVDVVSKPGEGMRVEIRFERADAAPPEG